MFFCPKLHSIVWVDSFCPAEISTKAPSLAHSVPLVSSPLVWLAAASVERLEQAHLQREKSMSWKSNKLFEVVTKKCFSISFNILRGHMYHWTSVWKHWQCRSLFPHRLAQDLDGPPTEYRVGKDLISVAIRAVRHVPHHRYPWTPNVSLWKRLQ